RLVCANSRSSASRTDGSAPWTRAASARSAARTAGAVLFIGVLHEQILRAKEARDVLAVLHERVHVLEPRIEQVVLHFEALELTDQVQVAPARRRVEGVLGELCADARGLDLLARALQRVDRR